MTKEEAIKEISDTIEWQNQHNRFSSAYIDGYIAGLQFAMDILNEAIPDGD